MEPLLNIYSFFYDKKRVYKIQITKLESKLSSDSAKLQGKKKELWRALHCFTAQASALYWV